MESEFLGVWRSGDGGEIVAVGTQGDDTAPMGIIMIFTRESSSLVLNRAFQVPGVRLFDVTKNGGDIIAVGSTVETETRAVSVVLAGGEVPAVVSINEAQGTFYQVEVVGDEERYAGTHDGDAFVGWRDAGNLRRYSRPGTIAQSERGRTANLQDEGFFVGTADSAVGAAIVITRFSAFGGGACTDETMGLFGPTDAFTVTPIEPLPLVRAQGTVTTQPSLIEMMETTVISSMCLPGP